MGTLFFELPSEDQQRSLTAFASDLLKNYGIHDAKISCINFEFNATFSVETDSGTKYALRININSTRTVENMKGEIEWVRHLNRTSGIHTPTPIATLNDNYIISGFHADSNQTLHAVMYSWLEGEELGDEPTDAQLERVGAAMARMHEAAENLNFSPRSELPQLRDPLWLTQNLLTGHNPMLDEAAQARVGLALNFIDHVIGALYQRDSVRPIHADMHGWNLMWHGETLSVFDFDDSGIGLPIQDIFTSIYYLDTEDQEKALLTGYQSVRKLPEYSEYDREALLLQRRLILLNSLYETSTPSLREMLPKYLDESLKRVEKFLALAF